MTVSTSLSSDGARTLGNKRRLQMQPNNTGWSKKNRQTACRAPQRQCAKLGASSTKLPRSGLATQPPAEELVRMRRTAEKPLRPSDPSRPQRRQAICRECPRPRGRTNGATLGTASRAETRTTTPLSGAGRWQLGKQAPRVAPTALDADPCADAAHTRAAYKWWRDRAHNLRRAPTTSRTLCLSSSYGRSRGM